MTTQLHVINFEHIRQCKAAPWAPLVPESAQGISSGTKEVSTNKYKFYICMLALVDLHSDTFKKGLHVSATSQNLL